MVSVTGLHWTGGVRSVVASRSYPATFVVHDTTTIGGEARAIFRAGGGVTLFHVVPMRSSSAMRRAGTCVLPCRKRKVRIEGRSAAGGFKGATSCGGGLFVSAKVDGSGWIQATASSSMLLGAPRKI